MPRFIAFAWMLLALTFSTSSLASTPLVDGYELNSTDAHSEMQEAKQAVLIEDYDTALRILRPLAENGDPVAQLNLGVMYRRGHGVERDEARGLELYRLSAEQGFAGGQHNLGAVLLNSAKTPEERVAAVKFFKLAADQGNEPSAEVLDGLFRIGLEAAQDGNFEVALRHWFPLAENGSARAQMNLATMYSKGDGVDKDPALAFNWYLKAAEQGISKGQFLIGQMLQDGEGTKKNPVEALNWFLRAAKQGDTNSQVIISAALALGEDVKRDIWGALYWGYAAQIEGSEDADKVVEMLERAVLKKTNQAKLNQFKKLVRECVEKRYEGC